MVSIGVMFVTQAVVRIIIGPSDRRFFDGEKFIIKAREFKEMTGLNEGLALKSTQVITIFVTIVLVSLLFWFLNKTKTGKSMKAYSDNEDLSIAFRNRSKKNSYDNMDYSRYFSNYWWSFIWFR